MLKPSPIQESDVLFKELAIHIGTKYKEVGVNLGLSYTKMDNEVDTPLLMQSSPSKRAVKMLQLWKDSVAEREFTYAKLATALVDNGLKRYADIHCYITA